MSLIYGNRGKRMEINLDLWKLREFLKYKGRRCYISII